MERRPLRAPGDAKPRPKRPPLTARSHRTIPARPHQLRGHIVSSRAMAVDGALEASFLEWTLDLLADGHVIESCTGRRRPADALERDGVAA